VAQDLLVVHSRVLLAACLAPWDADSEIGEDLQASLHAIVIAGLSNDMDMASTQQYPALREDLILRLSE